jgi:hypothetical protein
LTETHGIFKIENIDNARDSRILKRTNQVDTVSLGDVKLVDENNIRLAWSPPEPTVAH